MLFERREKEKRKHFCACSMSDFISLGLSALFLSLSLSFFPANVHRNPIFTQAKNYDIRQKGQGRLKYGRTVKKIEESIYCRDVQNRSKKCQKEITIS